MFATPKGAHIPSGIGLGIVDTDPLPMPRIHWLLARKVVLVGRRRSMSHPSTQPLRQSPSGWEQDTLNHWKEFRPKMYQDLLRNGQLHQRVKEVVRDTKEELLNLQEKGVPWNHPKGGTYT